MFKLNGRPFRSGDLEKALNKAAVESVRIQLRSRLEHIRHPTTGEFPTVVFRGDTLADLRPEVEGSPELLTLLRERLSREELAGMTLTANSPPAPTTVFLSYAGEDRALAKLIAEKLTSSGINTWWAEWEINAGDSLRQRIDEGLASCTHFLVLLSPNSRSKPWVNQEMDAGLVRRLQQHCKFIPLRYNLPATDLPPLLSAMLAPEVDESGSNLLPLIHQILEVTRKPALGTLPTIAELPKTGYSAAATAVARVFVLEAKNGETGEVQHTIDRLAERTELSLEDVTDALFELRSFFLAPGRTYMAKANLYAAFDAHFTDHDPVADALQLAASIVNDEKFPTAPEQIAERLQWSPRRLNSAVTYLTEREVVRGSTALSTGPYVAFRVNRTDATRRFVRSRS